MSDIKRTRYAYAASIAINLLCVAALGASDLVHPRHAPPSADAKAKLHAIKIDLATDRASSTAHAFGTSEGRMTGGTQTGAGFGKDAKHGAMAAGSEPSTANASGRARESGADRQAGRGESGDSVTAEEDAGASSTPAPESTTSPSAEHARGRRVAYLDGSNTPHPKSGARSGSAVPLSASTQVASSGSHRTAVAAPSAGGRPAGRAAPGMSISPKMVRYPKMVLNLGTVHLKRPAHGGIGGGYADMRDVQINAHFVADDPGLKHVPPNKYVHMFRNLCIPDPGNKSHCIAVGGNTFLGKIAIPGKHNHITGTKYCVAGAPGVPNNGMSQSSAPGRPQGGAPKSGRAPGGAYPVAAVDPGQYIGEAYHGKSPIRGVDDMEGPVRNAGTEPSAPQNPLHLPATHGEYGSQIPGARVPLDDRKWVDDPIAHLDDAPAGLRSTPMPRFTVKLRDVGSMSANGAIDWGTPHPVKQKRRPYGGDGTGLLGMYYVGRNFEQFVFQRPDRNIDYDWTGSLPGPLMPPDRPFSVRWIGKLVPQFSEQYTIMTASDDGVRVYLDGKLIISNWTIHAVTEDTATVMLQAGQEYNLKVEYFEKNGMSGEIIKLYWESADQPLEYIPESSLRYPLDAAKTTPVDAAAR